MFDWKERRIRQIRIRVACTVGIGAMVICGVLHHNFPTVHASSPAEMMRADVDTVVVYDFDTIEAKQRVFDGTSPKDEERMKLFQICNNIERWYTEAASLSVDFMHTITIGNEVSVLDTSYSSTDTKTGVSHVSMLDGDMWYDLNSDKCLIKPLTGSNYYSINNIDVLSRQEILNRSLYSTSLYDVQMVLRQLVSGVYRTLTDVNGSLSATASGMLKDTELPSIVDAKDNDNYTLYVLSTSDGLYIHLEYRYFQGDFTQEDIWYCIRQSRKRLEFTTYAVSNAVATNKSISDLLKGDM